MIKKKVQTVLFCRDANKQILFLLLQTNKERNRFWQNITGSLDPGEDYKEAALREALEETGIAESKIKEIRPTDLQFEFIDRWQDKVRERVFILEAKEPFQVTIDPKEHMDYKWTPKDQLVRDSVKYESNWLALKEALKSL